MAKEHVARVRILTAICLAMTAYAAGDGLLITGKDCELYDSGLVEMAGVKWEKKGGYDCFGGDIVTLNALPEGTPGAEESLKTCAEHCAKKEGCLGFNFPKGEVYGLPEYMRRCWIKTKGDQSVEDAMACKNGRATKYYDYYTLLSRHCDKITTVVSTSSGVASTSTPVVSTSSGVASTSAPVVSMSSGVASTSTPVVGTSSGVASTSTPVVGMSSGVASTSTPVVGTSSGVASTSAPVVSTSSGMAPTSAPVVGTSSGMAPTSAPVRPEIADQVVDIAEPISVKIPAGAFKDGAQLSAIEVAEQDDGSLSVTSGAAQSSATSAGATAQSSAMSAGATAQSSATSAGATSTALPNWIRFDENKDTFEIDPEHKRDAGSYTVQVSAADAADDGSSEDFTIHVRSQLQESTAEIAEAATALAGSQDGTKTNQEKHALQAIPTLGPPGYCHEDNTYYMPMDMNYSAGEAIAYTKTVEECQQKCRETKACGYFTWYKDLGLCHKAYASAVQVGNASGWQGGPATCDKAGQGVGVNTMKTAIMRKACLDYEHTYTPDLKDRPTSYEDNPLECQAACAKYSGCVTFKYNSLTKTCNFQGPNTTEVSAMIYEISGPSKCDIGVKLQISIEDSSNLLKEYKEGHSSFLDGALSVLGGSLMVTVGNYTPYTPEPGPETPVLTESCMEFSISEDAWSDAMARPLDEKVPVPVDIVFKLEPSKALYARQVLAHGNASAVLKHNANLLLDRFAKDFAADGQKDLEALKMLNFTKPKGLRLAVVTDADMQTADPNLQPSESGAFVVKDDAGVSKATADPAKNVWMTGLALLAISLSLLAFALVDAKHRCRPQHLYQDCTPSCEELKTVEAFRSSQRDVARLPFPEGDEDEAELSYDVTGKRTRLLLPPRQASADPHSVDIDSDDAV